jgi:4-hydroxy-tetrahydrodipicolinate synthase
MDRHRLRGTGVAVITPFTADKKLDDKALEQVINRLIYGGVEYLVILGTTGESVTLSKDEKRQVLDIALETADGRVPMIIGIGGNNTHEVVETIQHTDLDGWDAILSVSPYYNKPTQEGIYQHYKAISEASPKPILLYNVPGRTASNISAETTLRLANDFKNIIGTKEASGNFDQCMQIIKNKPADFLVISGDDAITLPLMAAGMDGVISVIANAYPKEFSDMVRACLRGNFEEARKLHYDLLDVTNLIFAEGNPGGIKALMEIKGIIKNELRLPLYKISDALYKKLEAYK